MDDDKGSFNLKKFLFGKISKKLFLVFLLIILMIVITGYIFITSSQKIIEKTIGDNSVLLAQETLDKIDRNIFLRSEEIKLYFEDAALKRVISESNQKFAALENVQQHINERDEEWKAAEKGEVTPFMQEIIDRKLSENLKTIINVQEKRYGFKIFGEIFVTNKYGTNIAQTGKTSDYYQADEEWWQKAKAEGLYVENIEYDESAGIYSLAIGIRIDDGARNFLGVVKAVLDIKEIIDIIAELKPGRSEDRTRHVAHGHEEHESMHFELLDKEGRMIYGSQEHSTQAFLKPVSEDLFSQLKENFSYLVSAELEPEEGEVLFSYAHSEGYKDYKGLGWILIIEHETKEIFSPLVKIRNIILLILSVVVVVALLLSFFLSRSISKPIHQLHKATEEVEKGNFKVRVNIKTEDELEQLSRAFNKTTMALATIDEEYKELEKAKTSFLSITSHELRSPMTPMKAQLQMLEQNYYGKLNPEQGEAVKTILQNTNRLDKIIVDFLEISRIEAARLKFKFENVDLRKTIERVVKYMKCFMPKKKIQFVTKIGKLPIIKADPDRINQVLINLVNNAVKFSKEKSAVEITAQAKPNRILLSVTDSGPGIKAEDQTRIFEPFFQAQQTMYRGEEKKGTGLGLAICRGIVESQNGKIWVKSELGKGSTFYFTVPLKPVKVIKPIRLLFSRQEHTEKKIKNLFNEIFGPLGDNEFEALKKERALTKKGLFEYINLLTKKGVIHQEGLKDIKLKISLIFREGIPSEPAAEKREGAIFSFIKKFRKKQLQPKKAGSKRGK